MFAAICKCLGATKRNVKIHGKFLGGNALKMLRQAGLCLGLLMGAPAQALGPVDGELGLTVWGVGDYSNSSFNTPLLGAYGELWLNERWGLRGSLYRINEETVIQASDEQTFIDLKYRLLSASSNTFLALGLGWDHERFGGEGSLSAPRLMAEGRLDPLGFLRPYVEAGWTPSLGDLGARRNLSTVAVEAGLVLDPFPFVDLRLAWRYHITEYVGTVTGSKASESHYGVLVGAGFHW